MDLAQPLRESPQSLQVILHGKEFNLLPVILNKNHLLSILNIYEKISFIGTISAGFQSNKNSANHKEHYDSRNLS